MPMPPELMELYQLYQQELETREANEKEALLVSEAKEILRVSDLGHSNGEELGYDDAPIQSRGVKAIRLKLPSLFPWVKRTHNDLNLFQFNFYFIPNSSGLT